MAAIIADFTLPAKITTIYDILAWYDTPVAYEFATAVPNVLTYNFGLGFLIDVISERTKDFLLPYQTFLDKTGYDFSLRFLNNKSSYSNSYSFLLRNNIQVLNLSSSNAFTFPYDSSFAAEHSTISFTLKYDIYKQRVRDKDFYLRYQIDRSVKTNFDFTLSFRTRTTPLAILQDIEFITNLDETMDLQLTLDPSLLDITGYNLVVDNGNRYLKYTTPINMGQDILEGAVHSDYEYTLVIPPFLDAASNPEIMEEDINYLDGRYGWSNAEADVDFASGGLMASGAFSSLPGRYPYALDRILVPILISIPGRYAFDMVSPGGQGILYLIDASTDRVVHISKCFDRNSDQARLVATLDSGTYHVVACTHENIDLGPGIDATFSITGLGPDFGQFQLTGEDGYSMGDANLPVDILFSISSAIITIRDISTESSISVELLHSDLSRLDTTWQSYIPPQEEVGYEPSVMVLQSPSMRFQIRLPDPCCFNNKIKLDGASLCRVPDYFEDDPYIPYVEPEIDCYTDTT
jgi:hypothetical protein